MTTNPRPEASKWGPPIPHPSAPHTSARNGEGRDRDAPRPLRYAADSAVRRSSAVEFERRGRPSSSAPSSSAPHASSSSSSSSSRSARRHSVESRSKVVRTPARAPSTSPSASRNASGSPRASDVVPLAASSPFFPSLSITFAARISSTSLAEGPRERGRQTPRQGRADDAQRGAPRGSRRAPRRAVFQRRRPIRGGHPQTPRRREQSRAPTIRLAKPPSLRRAPRRRERRRKRSRQRSRGAAVGSERRSERRRSERRFSSRARRVDGARVHPRHLRRQPPPHGRRVGIVERGDAVVRLERDPNRLLPLLRVAHAAVRLPPPRLPQRFWSRTGGGGQCVGVGCGPGGGGGARRAQTPNRRRARGRTRRAYSYTTRAPRPARARRRRERRMRRNRGRACFLRKRPPPRGARRFGAQRREKKASARKEDRLLPRPLVSAAPPRPRARA